MFLISGVDLVAPLPRPLVQILPTREGTPGQKVPFDEAEGPFYASRAVRIADGVRYELEAEPLSKSGHLRYRHHLASAATQYDHMRVVDHHAGCGTAHIAQCVGQK